MTRRGIVLWSILIAALAGALRLPQLPARPMHADEAILADKFGTLIEQGRFEYVPGDYHGPVLAYLTTIPAALRGQRTYAALDETTLRLVPAVAGIALALSPFALIEAVGAAAAIPAALLLAVSPVCVYYSRFYIPEMLLALLTALLLIAVSWMASKPGWWPWATAGLLAGSAYTTKETAALAMVAVAVAGVAAWRPRLSWKPAVTFGAGLLVPLLGLTPSLAALSVPAYWRRATEPGVHIHNWDYYLRLLSGWGEGFNEWPILLLGAVGVFLPSRTPYARFARLYCAVLAAAYFVIPYKTPWCVISVVYALAIVAGMAVQELSRLPHLPVFLKRHGWAAIALGAVVAVHSGSRAWSAATVDAASPSNQWAYAQAGGDVIGLRDRFQKLASATERPLSIGIWTDANPWPLPWYFRNFPGARSWTRDGVPAGPAPQAILVSASLMEQVQRKLYEEPPPGERELYVELFDAPVALRPGVAIRAFARKSVLDRETGR